ncbi:MAG TPA: PhzF family phenazine biosynthesis protein [Armatimonadota bacterium]|nr:PhzF family phenazine biosynthesis protein [Armatimonadota bacterium]
MRRLSFQQVDVFTTVPFKGNPVAVVLDGDQVSQEEAQAIARWTNLSETTFVSAPTHPKADYRLRIFTPRSELPFAGHPTIGSAHAVLRHGLKPRTPGRLVQECGKGLVSLRIEDDQIHFELPACTHREPAAGEVATVAGALGIAASSILLASIVDVGPVWLTLQAPDAGTVLAMQPDMERLAQSAPAGVTGVTVFGLYPDGSPADLEVRSFAPADGVPEDPVCGSGNGCVAALIQRDRVADFSRYVAAQGRCLGRDGRVHVHYADDGAIWVGGSAVTCVEGTLTA